ncbi:MAG TPA: metallophosphoesterase [Propionibacteriaceae bacterium]|nr:metallophosphoesterase [Propionibacteriaceae bacterium]
MSLPADPGQSAQPGRVAQRRLPARALRWPRPSAGLGRRLLCSVGMTVVAMMVAAPLAVAWGVGHARVETYLGPNVVQLASTYDPEVKIDLGPLGNAYLPSPVAPLGLDLIVGGVSAGSGVGSFLSQQNLAAYTSVFADPDEAVTGIADELVADVFVESLKAEAVLLLGFGLWVVRRRLLAPALVPHVTVRRAVVIYAAVVVVVLGSIVAPPSRERAARLPVAVAAGTSFDGLTVDSPVLSDLLDRGIKGVALLTDRQQRAVDRYVTAASDNLRAQIGRLPEPAEDETMYLGFSDLHCNQAMTELIEQAAVLTKPAQVLSSGDDTVNGTAAERGCLTREARIAQGVPFLVSTGNHDSDVTEAQMKGAGMVVLDGNVVDSAGLFVLGDDDPERQVPFSVERVAERPETEPQLGQRLIKTARADHTDVILVHQPTASVEIMTTPNPPARLVLWGHYHSESGPAVVPHEDGSWTVGMQQGTAGGVKQPTFSSFSTPFSPPLIRADIYFYFRDDATGLITGVQPVHFLPDATVVVAARVATGDLDALPASTREQLDPTSPSPAPESPR